MFLISSGRPSIVAFSSKNSKFVYFFASFGAEKLQENFNALMSAIVKAKPAAAKGQYLKSVVVASTMGPGIKINAAKIG